MPYIPTYARQLGVPSTGVGIMYAIFPFVGLIAKPTFGALADKFQKGKLIFISSIIFTAVFFTSIAFIPPKTSDIVMNFQCNGSAQLNTCNISDSCVTEKIEMEFQDKDILECKLFCEDPNHFFLEQTCNQWNVSETCTSNSTHIEMITYSNISYSSFDQTCLTFPIDNILIGENVINEPVCSDFGSMECTVVCNSSTVMGFIQNTAIEQLNEPYYSTIQFQLLFLFMAGAWASQAVVVSISDAICFKLLGNEP